MKVIGITGGIGSGKTTVAKMFAALGVPVYYADDEAKMLTANSPIIKSALIPLLGEGLFLDGKLNRKYMAERIFNDEALLKQVNAIIHPEVGKHFKSWLAAQNSPYVLKEAAILFESGSYKHCDATLLVTSPEEVRLKRVMERDGVSREAVLARMRNQWPEEEKRKLSDYIIENSELTYTKIQVENLHNLFLQL